MILVENDVGNVAKDLKEIDPTLRLRYSEAGEYFVVYRAFEFQGAPKEELVLTAKDCDQRIVNRVREIDAQGRGNYNFAKELEKADDQRKRNALSAIKEQQREKSAEAYHEVRRKLGVKQRIFVP